MPAAGAPGHAAAESRFTLCFALAAGAFVLVAAFARFGMTAPGGGIVSRHDAQEASTSGPVFWPLAPSPLHRRAPRSSPDQKRERHGHDPGARPMGEGPTWG
ncbi:hypothetical protein ACFYYN_10260 [Streptomyces sp. NPDC001902]